MIFDSIINIENYKGLNKIYDVLKFLSENDFSKKDLGRYEIDGDNVFYMISEYETDPNKTTAELHEKYIDIQYMIKGEELVGVAQKDFEKELTEAKPENDIWLYKCNLQKLTLSEGTFMVLYPNDLHMPGVGIKNAEKVRKVIVKVKV